MAYISFEDCPKCGKYSHHVNNECTHCLKKEVSPNEKIADEVIQYYHLTRGSGHTETNLSRLEGDYWVVVSTQNDIENLSPKYNIPPERFVTLGDFYEKTVGSRKPLVFDNFALCELLGGLKNDLAAKQVRIDKMKTKISKVVDTIKKTLNI